MEDTEAVPLVEAAFRLEAHQELLERLCNLPCPGDFTSTRRSRC